MEELQPGLELPLRNACLRSSPRVNHISTNIHRNDPNLVSKDSEGYREFIRMKKLIKFASGGEVENNFPFP